MNEWTSGASITTLSCCHLLLLLVLPFVVCAFCLRIWAKHCRRQCFGCQAFYKWQSRTMHAEYMIRTSINVFFSLFPFLLFLSWGQIWAKKNHVFSVRLSKKLLNQTANQEPTIYTDIFGSSNGFKHIAAWPYRIRRIRIKNKSFMFKCDKSSSFGNVKLQKKQ